MTKVLITGAAGFAGSHIAEWIINHTDWYVVALDCLTYAGHLSSLRHLPESRIKVVHHDFSKPLDPVLGALNDVQYLIHNGAESHVMRSLKDPGSFVRANVVGTLNVLEAARKLALEKFIYVSTDEVLGPSLPDYAYTERDTLRPSNPYSATKAGGEMLAMSYHTSFGMPVVITRTMNMFGERQNPEKFVPMTIKKILNTERVIIHANQHGVPNTRQWSHASVQASAQTFLLQHGVPGEVYHIAGTEFTNLDMAMKIALILGRHLGWEMEDISAKFPGHDHGYSLDDSKIRALGWVPPIDFFNALQRTVTWSKDNPEWLEE